jgi:hypothetical protein
MRIVFLSVSKSSDPERPNTSNIYVANVSDQDFISPVINN